MPPDKYVTHAELANVKNEIKLELTNEDTERRHDDRNKLNAYYFTVDELEKGSIKNNMTLENMEKSLTRLENIMREHITKEEEQMKNNNENMAKLLDKLDNKYAGKWTEKILVFIGSSIGTAILGALMYIILKR